MSLKRNFGWTFAGNLVNAVCQWGLIAIMAKLGSAAMVGSFTWALAIATPLVTFAMLQLRALLVTDTQDRHTFGDYLGLRLATMAITLAIAAAYGLYAGLAFTTLALLLLVTATRMIDGVSDIFRGFFQKHELMRLASVSMMLRGVTALAAVGISLWLTENLVVAMAVLCGVWLAMTFAYDIPRTRRLGRLHGGPDALRQLRPRLKWTSVKAIMPSALPMGLVMALIALQSSIPLLFLEAWHGKAAVGYFAAILYPLAAGTLVIGALGQSALPRLSRLINQDLRSYLRLLAKLLLIGLALGLSVLLAAMLLGRPFLRIAYTAEFAQHHQDMVIMAVGAALLFLASFLGYALTAARHFAIQPLMAGVATIVVAVSCWLLVPQHGVTGASLSYTLMSAASLLASAACFVWMVLWRRPEDPVVAAAAAKPDAPAELAE